jgi:hypothetical protein
MKSNLSQIIPVLAVGLWMFFSSCETSLDLDTYKQPRLTIIAHVAPDGWERQRVFVYATQAPSDSRQFYTPSLLEVDVTEVETSTTIRLDSTREEGQVFFELPENFIKAGYTYTIAAFAPGFEGVHATTVIPQPSTIENLTIYDVNIQPSHKNEFKKIVRYKVNFDIHHTGDNRYYHLVFYNEYTGIDNTLLIVDPELSDNQPHLPHYDFGILIDRQNLIVNQSLNFHFVDWVVDDNDLKRIYVELRSITAEYYKYHSTLARQRMVRQDPFAEPVTIFNNIQGGYGNFSGFSPTVSSSDLPL